MESLQGDCVALAQVGTVNLLKSEHWLWPEFRILLPFRWHTVKLFWQREFSILLFFTPWIRKSCQQPYKSIFAIFLGINCHISQAMNDKWKSPSVKKNFRTLEGLVWVSLKWRFCAQNKTFFFFLGKTVFKDTKTVIFFLYHYFSDLLCL